MDHAPPFFFNPAHPVSNRALKIILDQKSVSTVYEDSLTGLLFSHRPGRKAALLPVYHASHATSRTVHPGKPMPLN